MHHVGRNRVSIRSAMAVGTIEELSSSATTLRLFALAAQRARRRVSIPISAAEGQMANTMVRLNQLERIKMDS
jgi:hypothetical protein